MIRFEQFFSQFWEIIVGVLKGTVDVILWLWWLPLLVLYFYLRALKLQDLYVKNLKWKLLAIKIPKENIKTPKAMEQVLASLYSMHSALEFEEIWLQGKVYLWISLEIVGSEKGIYFYVYTPSKIRNLVESSFFSQYPEAEIVEVDDYTKELPDNLPNEEYDLMGADFILAKPNPFPMRTYPYFFESGSNVREERRTDPISNITEIMSNLKGDERIWIQVLIQPAENGWEKEGQKIISEISAGGLSKKKASKSRLADWFEETYWFLRNLVMAIFEPPVWPNKEKGGDKANGLRLLSPAEQNAIKAVENKISKLGYLTVVRFLLINKKEEFNGQNFSAMMGVFRQFTDNNLNRLRPAKQTFTTAPRFLFKKSTLLRKKKALFQKYIHRAYPDPDHDEFAFTPSVLNIEEIATIYHFPVSALVEAAGISRLPTKKGAPPANLPIG